MADSLSQTLAPLTLDNVRLHCLVCSVIDE
jgi:hypothetical protein